MAVDNLARGLGAKGLGEANRANKRLDELPNGMSYIGTVDYYGDLPDPSTVGYVYTVKYKGSSGTDPDGTEYVYGDDDGTNKWIKIGGEIGPVVSSIGSKSGDITLGNGLNIDNNNVLDVANKVPTPVANKVLGTDNSGNIEWQDAAGGSGGITEISTQKISIVTLDPGIYKLTYNGTKYIYFNGSNTTSTSTTYRHTVVSATGAVLLFVEKYSTTYWHWYYICGGAASYSTIYYGYTTTSSGTMQSCALSDIVHTATLSSYIPTSNRTNTIETGSTSLIPSVTAVRNVFMSGVYTYTGEVVFDEDTYNYDFGYNYLRNKLPIFISTLNMHIEYSHTYSDTQGYTRYVYVGQYTDTSTGTSPEEYDQYFITINYKSSNHYYTAKKYKLGGGGGSSDSPIETVESITPEILAQDGKYVKIADTEGAEVLLTTMNYAEFHGTMYYNLTQDPYNYLVNMAQYYSMELQSDPANASNRYLNIMALRASRMAEPGDKFWQYVLYIENYEGDPAQRVYKLRLLSTTVSNMNVNIIGSQSTIIDDITVYAGAGSSLLENSHNFIDATYSSCSILNDGMYNNMRLGSTMDGTPVEGYRFFMLQYTQAARGPIQRIQNGAAYTIATLKDLQDAIGTVMNTPV